MNIYSKRYCWAKGNCFAFGLPESFSELNFRIIFNSIISILFWKESTRITACDSQAHRGQLPRKRSGTRNSLIIYAEIGASVGPARPDETKPMSTATPTGPKRSHTSIPY